MQADRTSQVVIRYTSRSTTNGKPVGDVYVTGPHFDADIWSHTYRVEEAAHLSREEAERLLTMKSWARNGGHIVPLAEAVDLPGCRTTLGEGG